MEGLSLELEHRIDLFQTKISIALAQVREGRPDDGISTLQGALDWDKDIYQNAHKTTKG